MTIATKCLRCGKTFHTHELYRAHAHGYCRPNEPDASPAPIDNTSFLSAMIDTSTNFDSIPSIDTTPSYDGGGGSFDGGGASGDF